jgi:molecular chaperone DnaJ
LLVTVNVQVPADLSAKGKSAMEAYRDATAGPDPRGELLRQANG